MRSSVKGFRETARALRQVARFPAKQVGQASRKALTPMLRDTKANLAKNGSYRRGVLSRSMRIRKLKGNSSLATWSITATGRGVSIAHLVEAGTRPHFQPRRGIFHPGAKAKPFLEPAYEANDEKAVKIMVQELGGDMIKHARQVAFRGAR